MKFTEHRDSNVKTIKRYQAGEVQVNDERFHSSLYMSQKQVFSDWQCHHISALSEANLNPILEQKPEVIILGTGETQIFPDPKLFAYCVHQGIGLEVMANDAACRTYNILTTEDREVVLALIMTNEQNQ